MKKSEIVQGVILCWDIDHPINKFWKDYWLVSEVGESSFKIKILVGTDEVKEICFDSEFFTRMKISSPEEAYSNFVRKDRELAAEKVTKKLELEECGKKYDKFHEKLMSFKSEFKPHLISEAA